jgi:hypothetical protein
MERAVDWLRSARLRGLPDRRYILARIERLKLLEPLRRLIANGFEGRKQELADLRAYVDQLPPEDVREALFRASSWLCDVFRDRPILVLYGPGGSGKSTLVAKFVMDHAGHGLKAPMPFVYLDVEHPGMMPPTTDAMVVEALRQCRIQFPESRTPAAPTLLAVGSDGRPETDGAKSDRYLLSKLRHEELAARLNELAQVFQQNILFVIDTFEVVQRRGATAVYTVLKTAADLLVACPRLRIVVVGRSNLRRQDFPVSTGTPAWLPRPVSGFDGPSGRAYLAARLTSLKAPIPDQATLDRVVTLVRRNPLGIRLAASVLARSGAAAVEDAIGRQRLDEQIAQEQIQGLLHTRIVEQLDNPQLKRLADPGLIVRCITAPVIERVLARACGLEFDDRHTPAMLLEQLRSEVALVETVDDATVKHRSDVRRLMLPLLRRKLGPVAEEIDEAAVTYWREVPGPAARAEEIYHTLWLGRIGPALEPRWMPGAAQFLEDALDEFAAIAPNTLAHFWLAEKLERELPEETRKTADQLTWEWDTKHKARTLMASGRFGEVVRLIRERPATGRSPTSELWLIEIEALQLLGELHAARLVADAALRRAAGADDPGHMLALLTQQTAIEERLGNAGPALELARHTASLAEDTKNPARIFLANVTLARLLRETGAAGREERESIHKRLGGLLANSEVQKALNQRPPMLREAAAEIGADHPVLLVYALERVGLWSTGAVTRLPSFVEALGHGHATPYVRLEGRQLERAKDFEHSLAVLLASG